MDQLSFQSSPLLASEMHLPRPGAPTDHPKEGGEADSVPCLTSTIQKRTHLLITHSSTLEMEDIEVGEGLLKVAPKKRSGEKR